MGFLALWSVFTRSMFFGHNSNPESVQRIVDPLTQKRELRCQEVEHLKKKKRVEHLSMFQGAALVTQTIKSLPAVWETQVQSLGWGDSLEKGMAAQSSILAWRIPWSLEGYSPWNCRVTHDSRVTLSFMFLKGKQRLFKLSCPQGLWFHLFLLSSHLHYHQIIIVTRGYITLPRLMQMLMHRGI